MTETAKINLIWGVEAIADAISRTPRQTFHMCKTGMLPARKVGGRWVIERSTLIAFFRGEAA